MGIRGLLPQLEPVLRRCALPELKGMVAVIDASIYICKAIYTNSNIIQSLLQLVDLLQQCGVVPILILDGKPPDAKAEVIDYRRAQRKHYEEKAREYEAAGDLEGVFKCFKKTFRRHKDQDVEIKKVCRAKKIRVIQAPLEADAQIAFMMLNGFADLVITEDSDLIAFGCHRVLFKLRDGVGDLYEKDGLSQFLGGEVDMTAFRAMCVAMGCDYFMGGVSGIGPSRGLKLYEAVAHKFTFEKMTTFITKTLNIDLEEDFEDRYICADVTFLHQLVIHPQTERIVPLTPLDGSFSDLDISFAGNVDEAKGDVFYWSTADDVAKAKNMKTVLNFEINYHCRYCREKFETSMDLKIHREKEHSLYCEECNKTFISESRFTDHINLHKGEIAFFCHYCPKGYTTMDGVRTHTYHYHSGKSYTCPTCSAEFTLVAHFNRHLRIHSGERPFECEECQRRFKDQAALSAHLSIHTGEKPFECEVCLRCFRTQGILTAHLLVHKGEKPFKCEVCQRCFGLQSTLADHLRIHKGEKNFACDVCQKCFRTQSRLTDHLRIHKTEKQFQCEVCKKRFVDLRKLNVHVRVHSEEKPHECELCQRSFRRQSALTVHMRTHTGERPFRCTICQKSFTQQPTLDTHMRMHTGEKNYECTVCNKSFRTQSTLTVHSRTHTGEKPYECTVCNKSFRVTSNLTCHMRTHTGERPFKCTICQKSFAEQATLSGHIRTHTGERPFRCTICQKSFALQSTLTGHVRTHNRKN